MAIRKQLHDVLALTAELTHNNVNEDVRHTLIIDRMGLPEHETHRYIHELESLGMIKIQPRMNYTTDEKSREFRLINITNEGLQELSSNQAMNNTVQ
jgi:DNA-binding IclR family transcriptional regulator